MKARNWLQACIRSALRKFPTKRISCGKVIEAYGKHMEANYLLRKDPEGRETWLIRLTPLPREDSDRVILIDLGSGIMTVPASMATGEQAKEICTCAGQILETRLRLIC